MESSILLKNINLFGWHGVTDVEKKDGQNFEIDVYIKLQNNINFNSDNINNTIDYCNVYNEVVLLFNEKKYNLIESLADRISKAILKKFLVSKCKVIIRKPNAPIENSNLEYVEVEISNNV